MSPDERIAQIDERTKAIPDEISLAESKTEEAIKSLESIEGRIAGLREQRQSQLAADEKVDAVTKEIRSLREEKEILEDLVAGLKEKIILLRAAEGDLAQERKGRCLDAAKEAAIPLTKAYNKIASQLAEKTKEIHLMMRKYGISLSWSLSPVIGASSWESFDHVCRLAIRGEPNRAFFEARTFFRDLEMEKMQSEAAAEERKAAPASLESET